MQPATAEQDGPRTHRFTVSFDGSGLSFLDPRQVELAEGDVLFLQFQGSLNAMAPGVIFSRNEDGLVSPLGPFQEALQTADFVVLRGNSGWSGHFQCTALLLPKLRGEEQPLSSSNELGIGNGLAARPAKEVRVLVRRKDGLVEVTVDLEEVALFAHDSVVWNFVFENLEPREYEPLLYLAPTQSTPLPPGTGTFGPFQSLSMAGIIREPLGEGRISTYRLITSGNNNVPGRYHFNVGVRPTREGSRNEIFSVVDPIIDNSGPPHL